MPLTRKHALLTIAVIACAAAAPQRSTFTRTDCAAGLPRQCTGPNGQVVTVTTAGGEREVLVDGHKVFSVQGTVSPRAEWHLLGRQLTGLIVPVQTGGVQIYTVMRLAGPDAQSTCLVASTPQGGPARQLASRAQDMSCEPDEATEIMAQHR